MLRVKNPTDLLFVLVDAPAEFRFCDSSFSEGLKQCSIPCPIGINTGTLIKQLRQREHGSRSEEIALAIARNWASVEKAARISLTAAELGSKIAGIGFVRGVTAVARSVVSEDLMPAVPGQCLCRRHAAS
jgi:D-lactate dehydrogenase